jgi:hypothetical protein
MKANPVPKDLFRPFSSARGFFRFGDFPRAFLDYLILFSGISTRSNLTRTQRRPLHSRGIFLFRSK